MTPVPLEDMALILHKQLEGDTVGGVAHEEGKIVLNFTSGARLVIYDGTFEEEA